jgi:hypothetical protein
MIRMFILDPDLGSGSSFFTHPGSQGQKSHRIPDPGVKKDQIPHPQPCLNVQIDQSSPGSKQ